MKSIILAAALMLTAGTAMADTHTDLDVVTYSTDQSFDDVVFGLENAILDEGLVIESTSHTGAMLERTKADVGSDVTIFTAADVYSFCSAALSRKVMEADPMNIRFCPYDIFVMQQPGQDVVIGYRSFPQGEMQQVQSLLDRITKSAIGIE